MKGHRKHRPRSDAPRSRNRSQVDRPTNTECGACGSTVVRLAGSADFYTAQGSILTDLLKCKRCGTWFRDLDASQPDVLTHFDVASYTQPENEQRFRKAREEFFRFLYHLCRGCHDPAARRPQMLDIGCSYGHMMDVFVEGGYEAVGVEIVSARRASLIKKGYVVYASPSDIPVSEVFDLITLVDSLYCFNEPIAVLQRLGDHLKDGGILLIRVTNRTPILSWLNLLRRPIATAVFGDSKFAFSHKGIRLLCRRAGFRIERTVLREKGKRIGFGLKHLYYLFSPIVSRLIGYIITPGIIILCRKEGPGGAQ